MPLVCVSGAKVKIEAKTGEKLIVTTSSIPAVSNSKLKVGGKPALVLDDIKQWAQTYVTNYDFASFKMGMLKVSGAPTLSGLSTKALAKKELVTKDTVITLQANATVPAMDPSPTPPVPDSAPPATLEVTFTDPGQTKFSVT